MEAMMAAVPARHGTDRDALVEALVGLEYRRAVNRIIPRPEVRSPTFGEHRQALAMAKAEVAEAVLCTR
jgi:hypothetical protein